MCRNIRTLSNFEPPATHEEIHASSLQYVRKICGFSKPSAVNQAAFDLAVEKIEATTHELLESLVIKAPHKNRQLEQQKAREKAGKRYRDKLLSNPEPN